MAQKKRGSGGSALLAKHGPDYFRKLGKKSWRKVKARRVAAVSK